MWVPAGSDEIITRPGYQYVTGAMQLDIAMDGPRAATCVVENPAATFTTTNSLSSLPSTARVYIGFDVKHATTTAIRMGVATANTNVAVMRWEYWNGTDWAALTAHMLRERATLSDEATNTTEQTKFAGDTTDAIILVFAEPGDWTARTVGDQTSKFFIRATQITSVTLSAGTALDGDFDEYPDDAPHASYPTPRQAYYFGVVDYGVGVLAMGLSDAFTLLDTQNNQALGLALTVSAGRTGHKQLSTTPARYISISETVSSAAGFAYRQHNQLKGPTPTVAVIPQVSEVFIAYRNNVYNVSPTRLRPYTALLTEDPTESAAATGVLRNYFDAQVENDPAFVADALSPLNKDQVPQLDVFPAASSILYNDNVLWATRILGEPGVIRWSAPAISGIYLGYRVWPKINFAVIATNEETTAQGALHETTVVTTARTVFTMNKAGTDTNNFGTYAPTRVGDVGCLSQSSMQNWPGHLAWFANEGFYAFDGTPITDRHRFSDPIKDVVQRINKGRAEQMASAHWDYYNCYVCAVALDGSDTNNTLLIYDYAQKAWWIWDNVAARSLYVIDDELHFMDYYGNVYKFAGKHDYGTAIDAYYTTHRMGDDERWAKTARDIRLTAYGQEVQVALLAGDREQAADDISLGFDDDDVWDTGVWDTATWPDESVKERHIGVRQAGRWFQLKVSCSSKTEPMRVLDHAVGVIGEGRR